MQITFHNKISALHKKLKFSIKDFFSKFDDICSFLWIWSHWLKNSLMENFILCAVVEVRGNSLNYLFDLFDHFVKLALKGLSNNLRLSFCFVKIIRSLHPCDHPKKVGHVLKNVQKIKCVCFNENIWLINMKKKTMMKNRSHRYDINRPKSRHWNKYTKHKKCRRMICLFVLSNA